MRPTPNTLDFVAPGRVFAEVFGLPHAAWLAAPDHVHVWRDPATLHWHVAPERWSDTFAVRTPAPDERWTPAGGQVWPVRLDGWNALALYGATCADAAGDATWRLALVAAYEEDHAVRTRLSGSRVCDAELPTVHHAVEEDVWE